MARKFFGKIKDKLNGGERESEPVSAPGQVQAAAAPAAAGGPKKPAAGGINGVSASAAVDGAEQKSVRNVRSKREKAKSVREKASKREKKGKKTGRKVKEKVDMTEDKPEKTVDTSQKKKRKKKNNPSLQGQAPQPQPAAAGGECASQRIRRPKTGGAPQLQQGAGMQTMHQPPGPPQPMQMSPAAVSRPSDTELVQDKAGICAAMVAKGILDMRKEFNAEIKDHEKQRTFEAAADATNNLRRRYKNIACFDATRVRLQNGEYYHANTVDKSIILAQAPMMNTIDQFWDMVANESAECVVVMCRIDPAGKVCAPFFNPKANETSDYGEVKVWSRKVEVIDEITVITAAVKPSIKGFFNVNIYLVDYPPVGFPKEPTPHLLNVWKMVRGRKFVAICASGSGASAMYVLMHQILDKIRAKEENYSPLAMVKELRARRHLAVRNDMQYLHALRMIMLYLMNHNALDMSQTLLEFIDDYDAAVKKYNREETERREKSGHPEASEASDEYQ